MKRMIPVCLFLLISGVLGSRAQQIVTLKKESGNNIVLKYMFHVGSMMDPQGKEGLTRLTAGMVSDGGSQEHSKSEIDELLYPMAGIKYSSTDKEITVFTFEVNQELIARFYPVISGLLLNPAFTKADFDRLKSNQLNYVQEIIKASSDEEYSKMALEDQLFRGTAYQHMIEGTVSGIQNITIDDVREHFKKYFTKDNLTIGIGGPFEASFKEKVVEDASGLPDSHAELPPLPEISMPDGIRVEIIRKKDALGSAIYTGYPINVTRADDEFAALMVANSWLGEHRKSYGQLYKKLRETRSMNYGDYSYIEWYDRGGDNMLPPPHVTRHDNYFSIWIRPVQIAEQLRQQYKELSGIGIGHAHFALRLALRELDNLVKNGMDEQDFEQTRQFLRSYIKLYIQSPGRELGYLMDSRFYGRKDYIRELDGLLEKLTQEDVNRAIRKYFQVDNLCITIVTDDSEASGLAESIRNNTPSPMSYSNLVKNDMPAEVLSEDDKVAHYKLNVKSVKIIDSADMFQ